MQIRVSMTLDIPVRRLADYGSDVTTLEQAVQVTKNQYELGEIDPFGLLDFAGGPTTIEFSAHHDESE